jgi:hypothetical protein
MKQLLLKTTAITGILSLFASCLSKPQFENFCTYLTGLITLANKNMSAMSNALIEKKSRSSIARFLSSTAWNEQTIYDRYLSKICQHFAGHAMTLIIDDSLSKKTGKHIYGVKFHKSHTGKGFVFGHQVVTALLRSKDILLPLIPKLYNKKSMSKIKLAKEQILLALSYVKIKQVIMDSWYMSAEIITLCTAKGITVIGCVKSNRCINLHRKWINANEYFKRIARNSMTVIIINEEKYRYHEVLVSLKGVGLVKLVITQQWHKTRWSRAFYLVSTDTKRSAEGIITTYTTRWDIEVFHKDIKQHLGLESCSARRESSITRHLMLVTLAYASLKLWMYFEQHEGTIGDAVRNLQHENLAQILNNIVEMEALKDRQRMAAVLLS